MLVKRHLLGLYLRPAESQYRGSGSGISIFNRLLGESHTRLSLDTAV